MTRGTRRTFLKKSRTAGLTIVAASAARSYAANEQTFLGTIREVYGWISVTKVSPRRDPGTAAGLIPHKDVLRPHLCHGPL